MSQTTSGIYVREASVPVVQLLNAIRSLRAGCIDITDRCQVHVAIRAMTELSLQIPAFFAEWVFEFDEYAEISGLTEEDFNALWPVYQRNLDLLKEHEGRNFRLARKGLLACLTMLSLFEQVIAEHLDYHRSRGVLE